MRLHLIAGARPNFLKISSIINAINNHNTNSINFKLVHTGQHFDNNLSQIFFNDLKLPKPDINLNCGGGTAIGQISKIMISYEKYIKKKYTRFYNCCW